MKWQRLEPAVPYRNGEPVELPAGQMMFRNNQYTVTVRPAGVVEGWETLGPCVELSIRRNDRTACHDWRDFQRIKNDLCGEEAVAIEVYPPESRLVDTANQYYLTCFRTDIPIGFRERSVTDANVDSVIVPGAKQRPFTDVPEDAVGHRWHDKSRLALVRHAIEMIEQGNTTLAMQMLRGAVTEAET